MIIFIFHTSDYFKMLGCIENVVKDGCTEDVTTKILDFVRNVLSGIVDVACGDFTENSDKCDKLIAPPKKNKSEKTYINFFIPLIELFQSL